MRPSQAKLRPSQAEGFFDIVAQAEKALLIHRVRAGKKSGILVSSTGAVVTTAAFAQFISSERLQPLHLHTSSPSERLQPLLLMHGSNAWFLILLF